MKFVKKEKIETPRLSLRPITEGDAAEMIALLTDDEIKQTYMIPDLPERDQQVKMFKRFCDLSVSEEHFVYGICKENEVIGFINDVEIGDDFVELGYVISPEYKGRGYATEALSAAIEEIFASGIECVKTGAFEENKASIRVMEKCSMTRTDQVDFIEYRGKKHRCVYFEKRKG